MFTDAVNQVCDDGVDVTQQPQLHAQCTEKLLVELGALACTDIHCNADNAHTLPGRIVDVAAAIQQMDVVTIPVADPIFNFGKLCIIAYADGWVCNEMPIFRMEEAVPPGNIR